MSKKKVSTLEKRYLILSLINDKNFDNQQFFNKVKNSILEFATLIQDEDKRNMFINEQNNLLLKINEIEKRYLKYSKEIKDNINNEKELDKIVTKIVNLPKIEVDVLYKFIWIQLYKDKKKS